MAPNMSPMNLHAICTFSLEADVPGNLEATCWKQQSLGLPGSLHDWAEQSPYRDLKLWGTLHVSRDVFLSYWANSQVGALYCYSQLFLFSLTPLHIKGKDCAQVRIMYTQFLKAKISKQDKKLQHQWRLYRQVKKKSGFVLKTKNQDNVQMGQSFVVR